MYFDFSLFDFDLLGKLFPALCFTVENTQKIKKKEKCHIVLSVHSVETIKYCGMKFTLFFVCHEDK